LFDSGRDQKLRRVSTTGCPMLELPLHKSDSLCIGSLCNQCPVDFVSACGTTTIDGLGLPTAFGLAITTPI
jgi:hypothetical protein